MDSFFGMISNIDANMARLDAFLKKEDLYCDTILIFLSDNGCSKGSGVYNAGIDVPRWASESI